MIFEIVQEWAKCRPAMLEAIAQCDGTHTEDDVLEALLLGKMRLLTLGSSGVVLEIHPYPRLKALHAFLVGGVMEEVLELEKQLPAIAKEFGCKWLTCSGRHGWSRVLNKHGWETVTTFMKKDV